jgi:hypothetical protein
MAISAMSGTKLVGDRHVVIDVAVAVQIILVELVPVAGTVVS